MNRLNQINPEQTLRSTIAKQIPLQQTLNQLQKHQLKLRKEQSKIAPLKQHLKQGSTFQNLITNVLEQCQHFENAKNIQKQTIMSQKIKSSQSKNIKIENSKLKCQINSLQFELQQERQVQDNLQLQMDKALQWLNYTEAKRQEWKNKIEQATLKMQNKSKGMEVEQLVELAIAEDPNIQDMDLELIRMGKISQFLYFQEKQLKKLEEQIIDREKYSAEQSINFRNLKRDQQLLQRKYANLLEYRQDATEAELEHQKNILQDQVVNIEQQIKTKQEQQHNLRFNINSLANSDALKKIYYVINPKKKQIERSKAVLSQILPLLSSTSGSNEQLAQIRREFEMIQEAEVNLLAAFPEKK